jgi:hypothetical protein
LLFLDELEGRWAINTVTVSNLAQAGSLRIVFAKRFAMSDKTEVYNSSSGYI